ncbi:phage minor head protein [Virgibacillus siamensis]|uniref:phage minor head protein n=1 Tax=Virgibacillus siamensis TaxID=480071 RepID=UPI00158D3F99|nr:phage minor head protein [Virgibacillus siamensis]
MLDLLADMHRKYADNGSISRTEVYKYKRFEKEMERIKLLIHDDYKKVYQEINKLMKDQYTDNLLMSLFVYEMATQLDMQVTIPSARVVSEAILNPIKELTLSSLMNQHRNEIVRKIRIELAQGIQAGESYGEMAERLEKAVNFSRSKARRVARTESGRVQVESRLKSIEKAKKMIEPDKQVEQAKSDDKPETDGKPKIVRDKPYGLKPEGNESAFAKFWMAELDLRTRRSHRKLDGQTADDEGYFHYKGMKAKGPSLWANPSMTINCRCDVGVKINGKMPDTRRVRDYNDARYQQRLADRMDFLMAEEGLTEKQAERKAMKQVYPPNIVEKYRFYEDWYKDQPK